MSSIGWTRWKHFQETQTWPPQIVEKIVAWSPVDGGFNWWGFLLKLQTEIENQPYSRKFVLSWHIDTIGADWRDDYLIVEVYERDRGLLYNPLKYPGDSAFGIFDLTDELIPRLIAKSREFSAQYLEYRRKGSRNKQLPSEFDTDPDLRLQNWWREQGRCHMC